MLLILRYMLIDKLELKSDTWSRRQYWIKGGSVISNISAKALCGSDIITRKEGSYLTEYGYEVRPEYIEPILEILNRQ